MEKSENLDQLATALSLAQAEIRAAKAGALNPYFESHYADLGSVWEACREPLTKNGLSVVQLGEPSEGRVNIKTILLHKSGQWIAGSISMKPGKDDPQAVGSCISYARRYSLAAIVGIVQRDDDGEEAMPKGQPKPTPPNAIVDEKHELLEELKPLLAKLFYKTKNDRERDTICKGIFNCNLKEIPSKSLTELDEFIGKAINYIKEAEQSVSKTKEKK
jgi:hypothetical protein